MTFKRVLEATYVGNSRKWPALVKDNFLYIIDVYLWEL